MKKNLHQTLKNLSNEFSQKVIETVNDTIESALKEVLAKTEASLKNKSTKKQNK